MRKFNKGEWSEIYAFCYLLGSGVLYAADKDLNKLENVYYPIIKIIREEEQGIQIDYRIEDSIKIYKKNELVKEVQKSELNIVAKELLEQIPRGSRAFEIPSVDKFFESIHCNKVKEKSTHKQDITLQLHDINTGYTPICGFSIKSYLGANPTLINPGENTNIVYIIEGCTDDIMREVNSINTKNKLIDKMNRLMELGCKLRLSEHFLSKQFEENVQFIDTLMPKFLMYMVMYRYVYRLKDSAQIINKMKEDNPLDFTNTEMYTYKFKKLLAAWALGLTPERTDWLGAEDANGGYITVKKDGSIVCYHLYNRTDFEQYLYDYTYFDTPSTSKYHYFDIYKEGDIYKIKLCLQVRFK